LFIHCSLLYSSITARHRYHSAFIDDAHERVIEAAAAETQSETRIQCIDMAGKMK